VSAQSSFAALGTTVVAAVTDDSRLEAARTAVAELVDELDRACSRFRPDSELSAVNAAAGAPVRVGALLLDAVDAALGAATMTGGDVDPTVGAALIALGYDRDFSELTARPARRIVRVPGWQAVELDRGAGTVRVARGVSLDLGATAKALGADRAATRAFEAAGCGVLVSLGGDIALAGPAPEGGWRVYVTDEVRTGTAAPGQWIALRSGGLATSSTAARRWRAGTRVVHHLLDPRTGQPADGAWRTVSVVAPSCLEANIASTAAIVRGRRALEWLASLGLPSRLVSVEGRLSYVAGWPAEGEEPG
jgi:thiamine biosynthesis lipoprotein